MIKLSCAKSFKLTPQCGIWTMIVFFNVKEEKQVTIKLKAMADLNNVLQ